MTFRPYRVLLFSCFVAFTVASCAVEEYPASLWAEQHPVPAEGGSSSDAALQDPILCTQARATPIPARLVAMSASSSTAADSVVTEQQIYNQFLSICATCHNGGQGNFTTPSAAEFATAAQSNGFVDHVTGAVCPSSSDPTNPRDPMPPCNMSAGSYSTRLPTDPVWQFGQTLTEWAKAGYPQQFNPSGGSSDAGSADAGAAGGNAMVHNGGDGGPASPYTMTPDVGTALTEIGNCIPAQLDSTEDPKTAALDKMFEALAANPTAATGAEQVGLPLHLSDTDLFTFDSAVLAQYGVVGYAPGYPLWSDNAFKLRHVRVPYGKSIHFNKATQEFEIPPNTRFYKTFTKQIVDTDGSYRYRKIETRLIVSRPDMNNPDGTAKAQTALFGSYQWTADEKDAVLVTTPLNSEEPFGDTVLLYNTDEQLAADIALQNPANLQQALLQANAARNYAIPSSQRCIQCHMGSPSQSFNLGFTPLQINRRPTGSGGVIESAGPDELTQLQRFIDYGLITGIDSLSDVLPLEKSEGTRTPRNNYELVAQGYAVGNCEHCHNPRGFPSVQNPQLANIFDFLPSPTGGIFQFPLERYSPAIERGLTGTTPIPFITPSLVDLPRVNEGGEVGSPAPDLFVLGSIRGANEGSVPGTVVYAPWRSIVYRNVDAAFTYVDDLAIFPHMPFNTPGYDPRAKQILGDWMVSIPAVRKHAEINEYAFQVDSASVDNVGSPVVDDSPQPYAEVIPGAPGYDDAVAAAQARLEIFHTGINPALPVQMTPSGDGGMTPTFPYYSRYLDLGETNDILDPAVTANPVCVPIPTGPVTSSGLPLPGNPSNPYPFPNHPHWVVTDTTLPPPPWQPKNSDWPEVLVEQQQIPPNNVGCSGVPAGQTQAYADQVDAVGLLQTATLADVRGPDGTGFSATPLPFGLWRPPSASCNPPASVPLAGSFTGARRPHWMEVTDPPATAPVYTETPGAAVFKMICINCHGPNADSNGRLAANLATMTGGQAQVADFHDGLFGPASSPESNIDDVFGTSPTGPLGSIYMDKAFPSNLLLAAKADWTGTTTSTITSDDRAARYMPWMALGGTSVHIPIEILQIVAVTEILGTQRVLQAAQLSANMLSEAKALCMSLLGPNQGKKNYTIWNPGPAYLDQPGMNPTLLLNNGDAELWMRLCALANPPPIHILRMGANTDNGLLAVAGGFDIGGSPQFDASLVTQGAASALVDSSFYPAGTPVGNAQGGLDSSLLLPTATSAGNQWPWCVDNMLDVSGQAATQAAIFIAEHNLSAYVCPANVSKLSQDCGQSPPLEPMPSSTGATCFDNDRASQWAVRGAINAGMSVFLYVQSIEKSGPVADYNECAPSNWTPK